MTVIRRLPLYATGIGFTVALVAVADSRGWSDLETLLVALAVGAFYVATIVVPWLIREQLARADVSGPQGPLPHANGDHLALLVRLTADGAIVDGEGFGREATHGPVAIAHSEPHMTVR
jgi:hypothetical protein